MYLPYQQHFQVYRHSCEVCDTIAVLAIFDRTIRKAVVYSLVFVALLPVGVICFSPVKVAKVCFPH